MQRDDLLRCQLDQERAMKLRHLNFAIFAAFLALGAMRVSAQVPGIFQPLLLGQRGPIVVTDLTNANNTSGATLPLTATVPSGAAIVVCVVEAATVAGTVADSAGNTYSLATSKSDASGYITELFVAPNATVLSSGTITYTKHTSGSATSLAALYATNIAATSPVDSSVTATATSTNANPPVFTVTSGAASVAGDLFLGCVGGQQNGFTTTSFYTQDTTHGWATPPAAAFSGSGTNSATIQGGGNQVNAGTSAIIFAPTFSAGNGSRTVNGVVTGLKWQ